MKSWKHHPQNAILWHYTGNWINGTPHGVGEAKAGEPYLRIDYDGDWENGFAHGTGYSSTTFHSGHTSLDYHGGWQNGLFHGAGKLEADGGDSGEYPQFDGVFENDTLISGQMIGISSDIVPNAISYCGQFTKVWRLWLPHGTGAMTFTNGDTYVGQFEDGQPIHMTSSFGSQDT